MVDTLVNLQKAICVKKNTLDFKISKCCNISEVKDTVRNVVCDYPCEIDYRLKGRVKCTATIQMCDRCFSPEKVYACKTSATTITALCTGNFLRKDYPVCMCEKCCRLYQVCKNHVQSPQKLEYCAGCVRPRVRSSTLGVRISRLERRRAKAWIKGPIERVHFSEYSKLMDSEKELEACNVPDEDGFIQVQSQNTKKKPHD